MPTDHAAEATAVRQAWGQRGAAVCLQVACLGEHAGAHAHWHRGGGSVGPTLMTHFNAFQHSSNTNDPLVKILEMTITDSHS